MPNYSAFVLVKETAELSKPYTSRVLLTHMLASRRSLLELELISGAPLPQLAIAPRAKLRSQAL
jgi:hypothetical protein